MKYLKKYKLFIEEAEFDIELSDGPDIKMAKEKLTTIKNQLSEYKTKKPLIDNVYLKILNDSDLDQKVSEIIGKTDKDRNPFLVEYSHIASLKRKLSSVQKEIVQDKIKKDDFTEELSLSEDSSTKQAVNDKIKDITNRISSNTSSIASLSKEINDSQVLLDKKMSDIEINITNNMKKISFESEK